MQATLDTYSLKVFIRALTCLSKYGDEVSINATPGFLALSATNSSKSAYCRFKYDKIFFSRYNIGRPSAADTRRRGDDDDEVEEVPSVNGLLLTKSFLSILKHRTVEKSAERCELSIVEGEARDEDDEDDEEDSLESKLVIKLHCKHGVIKTHRLSLLTPSSVLSPHEPNTANESHLTIGPKALKDLLDHFPVSKSARADPQLVWTFDDTEVNLKTIESSIDSRGKGQLSSEITISSEEFDVYDVDECPTVLAFHLREFNATIAFADSMSLPLELRFTDPCAPLYIEVEGDAVDILFVISTSQVQAPPVGSQRNTQPVNNRKREREKSANETPRFKKPMKAAQHVAPEAARKSMSRAGSNFSQSMPPPSIIPNRSMNNQSQAASNSREYPRAGYSSQSRSVPSTEPKKEPLFLPSSQMSQISQADLRSIGAENMDMNELADLLDCEGEEVDFSNVSQPNPSQQMHSVKEEMDVDSLELLDEEMDISATQSSQNPNRTFQPLFED